MYAFSELKNSTNSTKRRPPVFVVQSFRVTSISVFSTGVGGTPRSSPRISRRRRRRRREKYRETVSSVDVFENAENVLNNKTTARWSDAATRIPVSAYSYGRRARRLAVSLVFRRRGRDFAPLGFSQTLARLRPKRTTGRRT